MQLPGVNECKVVRKQSYELRLSMCFCLCVHLQGGCNTVLSLSWSGSPSCFGLVAWRQPTAHLTTKWPLQMFGMVINGIYSESWIYRTASVCTLQCEREGERASRRQREAKNQAVFFLFKLLSGTRADFLPFFRFLINTVVCFTLIVYVKFIEVPSCSKAQV